MIEKGLNPSIGDYFSFGSIFYEITEYKYMRTIYGQAENIDGVSGLKYFVPSKPLVKVPNMRFDIDMQEDTNVVFAVDEQVETNTPKTVDTEPEHAD
jgi:hypothetical protein